MYLLVKYIANLNTRVSSSKKGNWHNPNNVTLSELVEFSRSLSNTDIRQADTVLDLKKEELVKSRRPDKFEQNYESAYAYFYKYYAKELDIIKEHSDNTKKVGEIAIAG